MMRVVVTGAAGFIGSHVAEILIADGHHVLGIDDLSGGFVENIPPHATFENLSVTQSLDDLFARFRPEAVFHLAAYAAEGLSHHIPCFNYTNNVLGTVNVLSAAYRVRAKHFVFTSSIAAYGHPHSEEPFDENTQCVPCDPYGSAKLACEHHIRATYDYFGGPAYTIFRPHNVFGPRQNISDPYRNVVGIFMACALQQKPMPIFGDGSQTRSFSHIRSVAHAIASAPFISEARNATFNIGGDEPMSVRDLAIAVSEEFGVSYCPEFLPARNEVRHAHCRHDLAKRVFPAAYANAIDIRAGLKEMTQFVKAHRVLPPTECPAEIEIIDRLPPSWAKRLEGAPAPSGRQNSQTPKCG
jgi:UDP-glucose 4-epimerase